MPCESKSSPCRSDMLSILSSHETYSLTDTRIVEQNITTALIMEDDIDWDIRIKPQLTDFAKAARLLLQPLPQTTDQFLDPSHPKPREDEGHTDFNLPEHEHTVTAPTTSPYSDIARWDLFWLGHCGCRFPRATDLNVPLGRVVLANDTTVPEPRLLDMELGNDELPTEYPPHTRVVSRARVNSCSLAYGISQPGARKFLYELGVHKMSDTNDMMFRFVCDGVDGRSLATCLTVQPQLFQHHRPVGSRKGFSDINEYGDGYNERATTANVRWSVRLNLPKLVEGETEYLDSFPDADGAAM
jgi:hypothetical protein